MGDSRVVEPARRRGHEVGDGGFTAADAASQPTTKRLTHGAWDWAPGRMPCHRLQEGFAPPAGAGGFDCVLGILPESGAPPGRPSS